ncbi:hypothetical protein GCM10020001_048590 [Nonomuraea salmonea]
MGVVGMTAATIRAPDHTISNRSGHPRTGAPRRPQAQQQRQRPDAQHRHRDLRDAPPRSDTAYSLMVTFKGSSCGSGTSCPTTTATTENRIDAQAIQGASLLTAAVMPELSRDGVRTHIRLHPPTHP